MAVAAIVVLAVLVCLVAATLLSVRARTRALAVRQSWTHEAGQDFGELSEAERCDFVFAIAALQDEASAQLLERALDDPSESVALAAARALARRGHGETLERYLSRCSAERARSLRLLVEILN